MQLQDAVISAQDASQAFNDEVLNEHAVFQLAKRAEMKELLGGLADGQITMYEKSIQGAFRLTLSPSRSFFR